MGEQHSMTESEQSGTPGNLLNTYILAGIGFACLIGWELSAVFSPALPLLAFCTIQEATFLRIVSVFTLAAAYVCFVWKQDWVFAHRNRLLSIGSLLALFAVVNTMVNLPGQWMPLWVSVVAWALFGVAQASIALYWCIFFSLIPTRRTAMTISLGAIGGTALYIFANSTGTAWLSLAEIVVLIVGSVGLAAFLSTHAPIARVLPADEYHKSPPLTPAATFSVACHGAVYGFMSLMICTMGLVPAVIVGASGFVGSLLAVLWAYLGSKVEIDTGIVQRISLPIIVAGLLLFPFFDDAGKIVCGCLVNIALAHSSVVTWCSTSIDNAEFQLHPVRFAARQAPNWVGFLLGTVFAYVITFAFSPTGRLFELVMALFAVLVVIVFSIYGGNESNTKKRLNDLLTSAVAPAVDDALKADGQQDAEDPRANHFRHRCDRVVEKYKLTPRETEVFYLLAKGRNAEYISQQLVVSSATVKSHIYHIYRKLGINSQQHLMTIVDDETGAKADDRR